MIKNSKYFFTGAVLLLLGFFAVSCNKTSPAFNRENIKATWMAYSKDGVTLSPEQYMIYSFDDENGLIISGVQNKGDGNYTWGESPNIYYYVNCCTLDILGSLTGFFDISASFTASFKYNIKKQKDSLLIITPVEYLFDSTPVEPGYSELQMKKLRSNYSMADSLEGTWQVIKHNDTPYSDFRLKFDPSGSLSFLQPDSSGVWSSTDNGTAQNDRFDSYSELLVFTLYNNSILAVPEKWGVSCFIIDSLSPSSKVLDITSQSLGSYHFEKAE